MNMFRLTALARSCLCIFTGRQLIVNHTHCDSRFWSWPFLVVTALAVHKEAYSRLHLSMINSRYRCSPDNFGTFRVSTFTWIYLLSYKFYRRKCTTTSYSCTTLALYNYSLKKHLHPYWQDGPKKYGCTNTIFFKALLIRDFSIKQSYSLIWSSKRIYASID